MLSSLSDMLKAGEQVKFTLTKQKDGQLKVMVQPVLEGDADEVKPEVADMRAALSMPLIATLPAADADAKFQNLLKGYTEARAPVVDSYEQTLALLKEAGKAGANTKREVETKKDKVGKPAAKAKAESTTPAETPKADGDKPAADAAPAAGGEAGSAEVPAAPVAKTLGQTDDIFAVQEA